MGWTILAALLLSGVVVIAWHELKPCSKPLVTDEDGRPRYNGPLHQGRKMLTGTRVSWDPEVGHWRLARGGVVITDPDLDMAWRYMIGLHLAAAQNGWT